MKDDRKLIPRLLMPGDLLFGYCGGTFGQSRNDRRVEAVGPDWVVVRRVVEDDDGPEFACGPTIHKDLAEYCQRFGAKRDDS